MLTVNYNNKIWGKAKRWRIPPVVRDHWRWAYAGVCAQSSDPRIQSGPLWLQEIRRWIRRSQEWGHMLHTGSSFLHGGPQHTVKWEQNCTDDATTSKAGVVKQKCSKLRITLLQCDSDYVTANATYCVSYYKRKAKRTKKEVTTQLSELRTDIH